MYIDLLYRSLSIAPGGPEANLALAARADFTGAAALLLLMLAALLPLLSFFVGPVTGGVALYAGLSSSSWSRGGRGLTISTGRADEVDADAELEEEDAACCCLATSACVLFLGLFVPRLLDGGMSRALK